MRYKAHRAAIVLFLLLTVTGLSFAGTWDFNPGQTGVKYKNDIQDDVQGQGFVMEYKKINTNNLSLLQYSHGSGSMDFANLLSSEQKTTTDGSIYYYWVLDYYTGQWTKKATGGNSVIFYTAQYDNKQSPTSFAYGTGWYAAHPVTYNSLLKDKAEAKSYQEAVSMDRQIEYARGYKGDIAVDLNCTGPTEKGSGKGLASMKIDDDVTQGTMHIGELISHTLKSTATKNAKNPYNYKIEGWRNPVVEIDLNYIGDFKVQKTMKAEITKSKAVEMEDWLPCCMGGFFDIPSWNLNKERASEVGVFDCTCRNTSISTMRPRWNTVMAQFPNDVYQQKP